MLNNSNFGILPTFEPSPSLSGGAAGGGIEPFDAWAALMAPTTTNPLPDSWSNPVYNTNVAGHLSQPSDLSSDLSWLSGLRLLALTAPLIRFQCQTMLETLRAFPTPVEITKGGSEDVSGLRPFV